MIGQRDNRLNIKTASASREIAEITLKDNAMIRRDSTDMRIIAGVTLVFLPGTFTATLFGSGFFNFKPQGYVSGWIWLYWVLTIGVTLAVLVIWWYFSSRRKGKMDDIEKNGETVDGGAMAMSRRPSELETKI